MFVFGNSLVAQMDGYLDRQLSRFLKKDFVLQPIILQEKIKKALRASVRGFDDGSVLIPNHIHVEMNDRDFREARSMGNIFHQKLHESAMRFLNEEFPNAIGHASGFRISLSASSEVTKGSFAINAEYAEGNSPGTEEERD